MAKNIADIGAVREHSVDGSNEFIFVHKGIFLSLSVSVIPDGPESNVSHVPAGETIFVVRAAQMNQVASLARPWIEFLFGWCHEWPVVRHPTRTTRRSMKRL